MIGAVHPGGNLVARTPDGEVRWWTWAGFKANATLAATLSEVTDPLQRFDDRYVRLRDNTTVEQWRDGTADVATRMCLPDVSPRALAGLKFNTALPERLAIATLAARLAALDEAQSALTEPTRFVVDG